MLLGVESRFTRRESVPAEWLIRRKAEHTIHDLGFYYAGKNQCCAQSNRDCPLQRGVLRLVNTRLNLL